VPYYVYETRREGCWNVETLAAPLESGPGQASHTLVAVVGTRAMADLVELETELSRESANAGRR